MHTDLEIIKDCLKGNQLSYKKLYERYRSYTYGICVRYGIGQADIKDVVQIIFTQAFQNLKNYDVEKAQFKTWFTHVCINNILSYKKKQNRLGLTQELNDYDTYNDYTTSNNIEFKIDKMHILSILKQMPEQYQTVFNLFIMDGYSHQEIAKQLNISIASSRVILNRARGWVKKTFAAKV